MQAQTQSPIIKNKKYKEMKDLPKTWVLRGKQIEDFRRKKNRNIILGLSKKPVEYKDPERVNWTRP